MFSLLNSSAVPVAVAVGGIFYFGWKYATANKRANENRRRIQAKMINGGVCRLRNYYMACAGSREADECGATVSAIDIEQCELLDDNRLPVDPQLFHCYVVHGDSMKYAGINDGDFILVPKTFHLDSLTSFPEILVIKYSKPADGKALYKVRRAWYKTTIDSDLAKIAAEIMAMPKFEKLTRQQGYKGADWMVRDLLGKRLDDYRKAYCDADGTCREQYRHIIISTTFDTVNGQIHFSIHPVALVVGPVRAAYTIPSR
ncbi:MAG: hypothetical protein K2M97_06000 [Muribaculaceae bacterium]|nr:hypothetical protein [Muribaculaceae bacterium]